MDGRSDEVLPLPLSQGTVLAIDKIMSFISLQTSVATGSPYFKLAFAAETVGAKLFSPQEII